MMTKDKNLTEVYNLRSGGGTATEDDQLDLRPENYQAFRIDSQVRPSNALLDFWFGDGNRRAIAYTHLYEVEFNPSEGVELTFSEHVVTIHGYCLAELYRGLKRHRIVFIWEANKQEATLAAEEEPVVTEITILSRHELYQEQNA